MGQPPANDPGVIFFLFIVGLILLAGCAYAVLLVARWNASRIRYVTPTRVRSYPLRPDDRPKAAVLPSETNRETAEIPEFDAETRDELICFGETQALARLVVAEKIGLTDAVKIGAGAKSGEKYQKRSREIKAAVAELSQPPAPDWERISDARMERVS